VVHEPHFAETLTVVRDDADGRVAWLPAGTPVLRIARADGLGLRDDPATAFTAPRVQATGVWDGYDVLRVVPTGARWSCWAFFEVGSPGFLGTLAEAESLVEAWGSPFCDGWDTFRPNPSWPMPAAPPVLRE